MIENIILTTYHLQHHVYPSHLQRKRPRSYTRIHESPFLRYADGSEEIYDHNADPNEWINLALKAESKPIRQKLSKWFPRVNAESAEYEQGKKK